MPVRRDERDAAAQLDRPDAIPYRILDQADGDGGGLDQEREVC
jgi:hypothetical protein